MLAARVPSGAAAARALRPTRGWRTSSATCGSGLAAEPFDVVDPDTGIKYTWGYDAVRAADALVAAGGGSRRTIAVLDTGADLNHPELAGRVSRTYDTTTGGRT